MGKVSKTHCITGGAGFIGSCLSEELLNRGHRVIVLDNLSHAQEHWVDRHTGIEKLVFHRVDLVWEPNLADLLGDAQVVWHLAANTNMVIGAHSTAVDFENGLVATYRLLEAMRQSGTDKIVFPSSGAVYGDIVRPPATEEYGPLQPVSLYGATKLGCEALMSAYCHLFGIRAWIFRFGNVLGAGMSHGVIYDFIGKLKKCPDELEILGDGAAEKNYILVEEIIDGMLYAFEHADVRCDVFNLGSPTTTNVMEIARIVCEEMGLTGVRFRCTGGVRGWPGDQPKVFMDVSKVRRLGWTSRHTSTEAVRIAVRRYLGKLDCAARAREPTGADSLNRPVGPPHADARQHELARSE